MDKITGLIEKLEDTIEMDVEFSDLTKSVLVLDKDKARPIIEQFLADHTQKEPLSKELEEFIKVFPPPYRMFGTVLLASNGKSIALISIEGKSLKEEESIGSLICSLLNKHFQEAGK